MKRKDNLENFRNIEIDYGYITEREIEQWIVTSRDVLLILNDKNSNRYHGLRKEFTEDLGKLLDYNRISQAEYNDIIETL